MRDRLRLTQNAQEEQFNWKEDVAKQGLTDLWASSGSHNHWALSVVTVELHTYSLCFCRQDSSCI
eukprot:5668364-Amphidinium_carterae.1